MKEYKYRCWVKEEKKMLYDWRATSNPYFTNSFMYRRNEIELMQSAEIDDSDGIQVYEDDILEIWVDGIKQDDYYIVEDLRELYLEMNRDDSYYRISKIKIIGNKWENPEILEIN